LKTFEQNPTLHIKSSEIERLQQRASRLTLLCVISFIVFGGIALIILKRGGPEALGAIIPMMILGAIHLIVGPIAVFHAYKTHKYNKNWSIFFIFFFLLVSHFW